MTTIEEFLASRVPPKSTEFKIENSSTGEIYTLKFKVPSSVQIAEIMASHRDNPIAVGAAIVGKYLQYPSLDKAIIQQACEENAGEYVDKEIVAAQVFNPSDLISITEHIFDVARINDPSIQAKDEIKNSFDRET